MFLPLIIFMGTAAGCLLAGKILLHYFQLESYQHPGYFRTIKRNPLKAFLPGFIMSVLLVILFNVPRFLAPGNSSAWFIYIITALMIVCGGWAAGRKCAEKHAKKTFVLTPRVKRLYAVSFVVMTLIQVLIYQINGRVFSIWKLVFDLIAFFPLLLPLWVALCGLIAWPVEKLISEMYFRDAQRILRERSDLIRIGITGSWGKTSVKFILGTILGEKYQTLVTPASFNTPMGVTKIIRTRLEPRHRVFVAEMGARHVGDIKEMCRLVHPQYGLLTSVGPQHLDTFKTVERVARTKYELVESLPPDGTAFFADDGGICRDLFEKTRISKFITGLDNRKDDLWAEEIEYSPEGSSFYLCGKDFSIHCSTELLGELNIRNILLCAGVAFKLGLTKEQIIRGIQKIRPVEHRLQLIRHPGGLNVIDDAFNSNIRGARQAFEVLSHFPGRRIVVTPGMVELGDREYEMNRDFGAYMAGCCDTAILVGKKRSEAISEGLKKNGFSNDSIIVVPSLTAATDLLQNITGPGDTVLFENDLPDNYSES